MNHQTEVPQMDHQQFEDWMDALRRLAVDAFSDPRAREFVRSVALHDIDPRVRETARGAVRKEMLRRLHSGSPEARLSVTRQAADLLPIVHAGQDIRHTG